MAYQVLARKWRPKTFADLVGQEHVVQALRNALAQGRLHHAYLLTGTRGVGKTTIARILAKSLNCEHPQQGEPCGVCAVCGQIDAGRFPDLLEIDAASNTGIDNIREVLENAQYAPTAGRYKVYIIDEVHMLSKSAFNAMLKTLEEPPEHVKFILATTDPQKVPVTVLSRCLQFVLHNMSAQQVSEHLEHILRQEGADFEKGALQLLGRAAAGSMRDALSLLDQAIALGSGRVGEEDVRRMIGAVDKRYLYDLLQGLAARDGEALMAKAQEMSDRAIGFDNALNELALLLQRLALLQTVPSAMPADDADYPVLKGLAGRFGAEQVQLYYQCALRGKQDLPLAPDEYAGFVMTLLRMLAFAPLAAAPYGTDDAIEGTELGGNTGQTPPAAPPPPEPGKPAGGTAADSHDIPPWEEGQGGTEEKKNEPAIADGAEAAPPVSSSRAAPDVRDVRDIAAGKGGDDLPAAPLEETKAAAPAAADMPRPEHEGGGRLPAFAAENWPQIIKALSRKLGAAQMLADQSAWLSYDEAAGRLCLAVGGRQEGAAGAAYADKIRDVLALAYGLPGLVLQTRPWLRDSDLETPAMRRDRLQKEGREQAKRLLEGDPACAELMKGLAAADWKEETLVLAEKSPQ
ncbi:MAG: DNA polymerase III subunit gamma/tau [Neisseria sp.]|nr:DNA polymerase III subunit gamma/tau [Neisseria sp.]